MRCSRLIPELSQSNVSVDGKVKTKMFRKTYRKLQLSLTISKLLFSHLHHGVFLQIVLQQTSPYVNRRPAGAVSAVPLAAERAPPGRPKRFVFIAPVCLCGCVTLKVLQLAYPAGDCVTSIEEAVMEGSVREGLGV